MPAEQPAGTGTKAKDASFANPSTKVLFDHWKKTIEAEILALLKEGKPMDVGDLAVRTKMSGEAVDLFVRNLVEEGKLRIRTVSIVTL
jgi:hypothetical protein